MNLLTVRATAKSYDVIGVQHQGGGLPVQGEQTLVGCLQEHVGEVLPQRQGRRVGEQPLAQNILSSDEITCQDQLSTESVGQRRYGFDHLVHDRRGKGPGEVARGVSRERRSFHQVERLTSQGHRLGYRSLHGLTTEILELHPVGREVLELVTGFPRRRGQVSLADGPSSVDHVIAHGRLLDIGTGVRERPDGSLNLFQRERTIVVHREEGHDGPHRITRRCIDRQDSERTEDVDPQYRLFLNDLPSWWHYGWRSRYWLFEVTNRRLWKWGTTHHDDRRGTGPTFTATSSEMDDTSEQNGQRGAKDIQQVGRRRAGSGCRGGSLLCMYRYRHRQLFRERQSDPRWPSDLQRHWRETGEAVVLHAVSGSWQYDERATSIRDGHREVVRRVDHSVVSRSRGIVRLVNRVYSRRDVAAARSRYVAQGRSGHWCQSGEEVSPEWISGVALAWPRTHLQRQVDLTTRRVSVFVHGILRVECGRDEIQHAGHRCSVRWIGHGYLMALCHGVDTARPDITRARRCRPRKGHDEAKPQRERGVVDS